MWIKVKQYLFRMDKGTSCPKMTDIEWIGVWDGRTALYRVASVPSRSRKVWIGVRNECVKVDNSSYVYFMTG